MSQNELKITYRNPTELKPYMNNARTHSKKQVKEIADSIQAYGFNNPILLDGEGIILAGHGRLGAALLLKLEQVPTIDLSHLNESEKRAYILADNKIALNAGWDGELLKVELGELKSMGIELEGLGFSTAELAGVLSGDLVQDPDTQWNNMPQYNQQDKMPHRTLFVHFTNDEDVKAFSDLVQQTIGEKTKSIWYPKAERLDTESKRYD